VGLQIIVPVPSLELAGIALPTGAAVQYLPQEPVRIRLPPAARFAADSPLERDGFEPSVPPYEASLQPPP
jgi:hypothetical protein